MADNPEKIKKSASGSSSVKSQPKPKSASGSKTKARSDGQAAGSKPPSQPSSKMPSTLKTGKTASPTGSSTKAKPTASGEKSGAGASQKDDKGSGSQAKFVEGSTAKAMNSKEINQVNPKAESQGTVDKKSGSNVAAQSKVKTNSKATGAEESSNVKADSKGAAAGGGSDIKADSKGTEEKSGQKDAGAKAKSSPKAQSSEKGAQQSKGSKGSKGSSEGGASTKGMTTGSGKVSGSGGGSGSGSSSSSKESGSGASSGSSWSSTKTKQETYVPAGGSKEENPLLDETILRSDVFQPLIMSKQVKDGEGQGEEGQAAEEAEEDDGGAYDAEYRDFHADAVFFLGLENYTWAAIFACSGSISTGLNIAFLSTAKIVDSESGKPLLTDDEKSTATILMPLFAVLGAFFSALILNRNGRTGTMLIASINMMFGFLILTFTKTAQMFLIGRCMNGFSVGILSLTVPLYITEIVPANERTILGGCHQASITIGIFFAALFGVLLDWYWLAFFSCVPSLILMLAIFLHVVEESPLYLISNNFRAQAIRSLAGLYVRNDPIVELDLYDLRILEADQNVVNTIENNKRVFLRAIMILTLLHLIQQFSGINLLMFFATNIFTSLQVGINPNFIQVAVTLLQVIITAGVVGVSPRLGRRGMWLISIVLLTISIGGIAFVYPFHRHMGSYIWSSFIIGCVCLYMVGFAFGLGIVPWLMMGELLPIYGRSIGAGYVGMLNWGLVLLVSITNEDVQQLLNYPETYVAHLIFLLFSYIISIIVLPETENIPLHSVFVLLGGEE